jgi:hypothetical protein
MSARSDQPQGKHRDEHQNKAQDKHQHKPQAVDTELGEATERVLGAVDGEVAAILRGYLAEPFSSPDVLQDHTNMYMKQLEGLVAEGDVIDLELASDLAVRCVRMAGEIEQGVPEEHRRLIQAAIRYFVNSEDADGDIESLIGFDDDSAVIEAVALAIGCAHILEDD